MYPLSPPLQRPSSVLFACTYNAIRSPMAESMLKHLFPRQIFVDSVGVRDGELDPFAVTVMGEMGIDLSRHRPKTFDQLEDENFDLVITLSPEAHHRALEMTRTTACDVEFWKTMDPTLVDGSRDTLLSAFRGTRDYLRKTIEARFGAVLTQTAPS